MLLPRTLSETVCAEARLKDERGALRALLLAMGEKGRSPGLT